MLLSELIDQNGRASAIDVAGLACDSRDVQPGYLFAAFPGAKTDGAQYVADAIARGAVAVLAAPDVHIPDGEVYRLAAANPRRRFASLVARFYGPQPDTIAAITGTNGKTSVASFTRQIWQHLGYPSASIGTLGVMAPGYERPLKLTTPDTVTLHEALRDLKLRGIEHVACEASSHGLVQHRLDGLVLRAAAFTNLSRDHMDYHSSVEDYFFAKARLFGEVMKPGGVAVLNVDDPHGAELESLCWARGHKVIGVGEGDGDLRLLSRAPTESGQVLTLSYKGRVMDLTLPLVGAFQAMNALISAGLAAACGADEMAALNAIQHLRAVPGRLQLVGRHPTGARVYVDYAHTPDALKNVLTALRPHTAGRLKVVFGCGGDRDAGKRPLMGEVAAELADEVFVTDDNPRSENPAAIRDAVMAGCPDAHNIGDRRAAIRAAVADLQAGDTLVVAGKGHETGQIIGTEVIDFNDAVEVRNALAGLQSGSKVR
jgi:UDP-N-acetylmuramoyl-L-alanyl-D-glutamate--2,6-diaminopimelate ligase